AHRPRRERRADHGNGDPDGEMGPGPGIQVLPQLGGLADDGLRVCLARPGNRVAAPPLPSGEARQAAADEAPAAALQAPSCLFFLAASACAERAAKPKAAKALPTAMFKPILIVFAFLIVAASGLVQGTWSGRWVPSQELERARERLEEVPTQVGEWEMTEEKEVPLKEQQIAGMAGYRSRVYVNRRTNHSVSVLLVCGRPGAIAVHTPDVCFEGAGYRRAGNQSRDSLVLACRGHKAEFLRVRFVRHESGIPIPLLVYWGWNGTGSWTAPERPRLEFWKLSVLYKLYVSRIVTEEEADPEPCFEFLREFLPALHTALFTESSPAEQR